ncbi:6601_t:CDS:2, partial [Racocetra fulgida]
MQYFQVNGKVLMISQNFGDKLNIEPKISDLGLSRPINELSINRGIYVQEWKIILNKETEELDQSQIEIKNKFLNADKIIPTIRTTQKQ